MKDEIADDFKWPLKVVSAINCYVVCISTMQHNCRQSTTTVRQCQYKIIFIVVFYWKE